jgi:O-antigen/teichoic acid export membrane protein
MVLASDGPARLLLVAGIALLWIQAAFEMELERARIKLLPTRYGVLALGRAILSLALGVLFVWLGLGALGLIAGLCLGMLITLAKPLADSWGRAKLDLCDWALLWRLTKYGAPLAVTAALSSVIAVSDRLLIGWLLGERSVGLYAVGYDLANSSLGVLLMVVNLAAYPLAVRALEERGEAAARRQVTSNLTALLAIGLPASIGFAVLAQPIADVLIGQQFRAEAAMLIPLIAIVALLRDIKAYYLDLAFYLSRKTVSQIWVTITAVAVSTGLNLWWIPVFGIVGAAYAAIGAYAVAFLLSALLGRRVYRLPGLTPDAVKIALAACLMGAFVWQIRDWSGPAALFAQVLAGAAVYGLLVFILDVAGIRPRALTMLGEWLRRAT